MTQGDYAKGLEGVVAAESEICLVDGESGKLYYRGYSIDDLAERASYEETVYLLLYGSLPSDAELTAFTSRMRSQRGLEPGVREMIRAFPADGSAMELLQSVISYLSGYVAHRIQHSATCNCRSTLHQIAQLPTVLATFERFRNGEAYVEPDPHQSHGGNFLYMLRGETPDPDEAEIMDRCFVLHAEHEFNASTFTARVVASTLSTCYCSISAAIGALYGSLHGGANEAVLDTLDEIGTPENIDPWLDGLLAKKGKVMGMGHRVYKVKDPRAVIIERYLRQLSEKKKDTRRLDLLKALEERFAGRMQEKGKAVYPNVDFFAGAVYELLGIPRYLFTPVFAASRSAGWLAHILEQRKDNRLYRPTCLYVGPEPTAYPPLASRDARTEGGAAATT